MLTKAKHEQQKHMFKDYTLLKIIWTK